LRRASAKRLPVDTPSSSEEEEAPGLDETRSPGAIRVVRSQHDKLRNTKSTFARGDYSFSPAGVRLVDDSREGIWRRTGDTSRIRPDEIYTNRFVERAMKEIE